MSDIMICEHSHAGFVHATFNAALLTAMSQAFPNHTLVFLSTQSHFDYVQDAWRLVQEPMPRNVVWADINSAGPTDREPTVPDAFASGSKLRILKTIIRHQPKLLVYGSTGHLFILITKLLPSLRIIPSGVVMIWHELLSQMVREERDTFPPHRDIYRAVRVLNSPKTFQLALSPSVKACLTTLDPSLARFVVPIHLPCLWKVKTVPDELVHSPVRFGHLGGIYWTKGFDRFIEIAQRVTAQFPEAEFVSVGKVLDEPDRYDYQNIVQVSKTTIPPEEYAARAQAITFSVITSPSEHYRVAASLSFLDALSYGKPGIYLRNPFIEYCFEVMGDVGYLCESYDEMAETMLEIMREFPHERYRQQCENIFKHRDIFHASSVAHEFRALFQPLVGPGKPQAHLQDG